MHKNDHFHLLHYIILAIILSLAVVLFFISAGNSKIQFNIAIITAFVYFIWGIIHHLLEGDLHPKIVVEYLLIALLAIFILKGALFR